MLKEVEDLKKEIKDNQNQQGDKSVNESRQSSKTEGQTQSRVQSIRGKTAQEQTAYSAFKSEPLPPPPIPQSQSRQYYNQTQNSVPPSPVTVRQQEDSQEREIGAIDIASNRNPGGDVKEKSAEKKAKRGQCIYPLLLWRPRCSVAWMHRQQKEGREEPVPVLLRIRRPCLLT